MKTNLNMVKERAIQLIYAEPKVVKGFNVCLHPYIDTPVINGINIDKPFNIFQDTEKYLQWQEQFKDEIVHRTNVYSIFSLLRPSYRMEFFNDINQFLSVRDFAEMLAVSWSAHGGKEISVKELVRWFNKADKTYLMNKKEYKVYSELPEQVTIYRGAAEQYKYGMSWTLNKKVAFWYAEKYKNQDSCVYECEADKKALLCYFKTRSEAEVLISPSELDRYKLMEI